MNANAHVHIVGKLAFVDESLGLALIVADGLPITLDLSQVDASTLRYTDGSRRHEVVGRLAGRNGSVLALRIKVAPIR